MVAKKPHTRHHECYLTRLFIDFVCLYVLIYIHFSKWNLWGYNSVCLLDTFSFWRWRDACIHMENMSHHTLILNNKLKQVFRNGKELIMITFLVFQFEDLHWWVVRYLFPLYVYILLSNSIIMYCLCVCYVNLWERRNKK